MKNSFVILTYHRVLDEGGEHCGGDVDKKTFKLQMQMLRRCFNVLSLGEALDKVSSGPGLPSRCVAVTFDDGYMDNYSVALPILEEFDIPATFFIASAFTDGGIMWNDSVTEAVQKTKVSMLDVNELGISSVPVSSALEKRRAIKLLIEKLKYTDAPYRDEVAAKIARRAEVELPSDLMMSSEHIRSVVDKGMEVGAHTHSHVIVRGMDEDSLVQEIALNIKLLQKWCGEKVRGFAYPNGRFNTDYSDRERRIVANLGFDYAVSTDWGRVTSESNIHSLPRISPWDKSTLKWGLRVGLSLVR